MFKLLSGQVVFEPLDNEIFDAFLSLYSNFCRADGINVRRLKRFAFKRSKKLLSIVTSSARR